MAATPADPTKDDSLEAHLEFAVREIMASQHLRVLVRHVLSQCRVAPVASVFDTNPVQNAYNQGYQAAGMFLADILTSVDPSTVPTLLLEELAPDANTE